uniref:Uncharacterized protein n=1 Tax=Avena sativa TaxID=4498 RepID=A0ACD6A6E7_AVESA
MRRRSTWRVLGTVLWLAYLSADSVAIFVLGHLAVRGASGPEHELLLFWAPFLLVHLGGQDTITALSVQDNELWTRHLLGLVSQVAVAGYVVSKSSWQDRRMLAATVLVFLSGSFKYAGRTYCLYSARPANVRVEAMRALSHTLGLMKFIAMSTDANASRSGLSIDDDAHEKYREMFDVMLGKKNRRGSLRDVLESSEIMSTDAPLNEIRSFLVAADFLPTRLKNFQETNTCLRGPYEYVGETLLKCYERFYTKGENLISLELVLRTISGGCGPAILWFASRSIFWLILTLYQYLSTPIALVLFILAEKGHQVHNRADVIVTYILLVGAIILDACSAFMSIVSFLRIATSQGENRLKKLIFCIANCIQQTWSRKQWSEKLGQYNMVKRYTRMEDTRGMSYVWQRINRRLATWGVELLDPSLTHTPVTEDLKGFVLNNLLQFGISKQYNFAKFRGQLALQKWIPEGPGTKSLYYSINGVKDFPTSVLIWHIATDICYYSRNNNTNINYSSISKKTQMSRELSNYILYLVFKCGVMLTSKS